MFDDPDKTKNYSIYFLKAGKVVLMINNNTQE